MKRHATTIVLLVIAVVGAVWLWFDRDKVTEGERKRRENNIFQAWRREDVSRIEIAHEGETIVLERSPKTDSAWRMTSPRSERVDQAAAERLTTTLEFATRVRKVSDEAKLGLEEPRASGAVTMGPLVFRFVLGAPSPRPEGSSYFRVDDEAPFVASKELTDALLASSDVYRDRTVIPYLSLEMSRFEVKHPGGGFALERADERSFKVAGLDLFASRSSLDKVWEALAEMRAEIFPKEADADRLTANPRMTITMAPKDQGKPASEIVVGEECPGHPEDVVVLRKTPTRGAACAPKGAIAALAAVTPDALVDRRPFSFRHDEIEELRLESTLPGDAGSTGAPRVIELARRGNGFHQREPVDRELSVDEADAVSELLAKIEQAEADEVRPTRPTSPPFAAIARARVRAGDHEETVEVGSFPMPAEERHAMALHRLRDGAFLVVRPDVARRLVPRATTTHPRTLLGDARRVSRLALRCGTAQDFVDDGSGLELVDPAGYATDGSITQLVDGLVRGKVIAWVADSDDGSFGLTGDKGRCAVALSFADGSAPVTVRFGGEGEGGVYGTVEGRGGIFVAPAVMRELAQRIYVSHASLRVDPSRVESVKVTQQGKPVLGVPADALRDAAGALYADRALSIGTPSVGAVDVDLLFAVSESGPPKQVRCGAAYTTATGHWRRCATSDVKATFEVRASLVDAFVRAKSVPDAGR